MSTFDKEAWETEVFAHPTMSCNTKTLLVFAARVMSDSGIISQPRNDLAARLGRAPSWITAQIAEAHHFGFLYAKVKGVPTVTAVYQATMPSQDAPTARPASRKSKFNQGVGTPDHKGVVTPDPSRVVTLDPSKGSEGVQGVGRSDPSDAPKGSGVTATKLLTTTPLLITPSQATEVVGSGEGEGTLSPSRSSPNPQQAATPIWGDSFSGKQPKGESVNEVDEGEVQQAEEECSYEGYEWDAPDLHAAASEADVQDAEPDFDLSTISGRADHRQWKAQQVDPNEPRYEQGILVSSGKRPTRSWH